MEKYSASLDSVFQALADPTRRAVLGRLGHGEASVGDLAAPFDMALPSFMKHIQVLEGAGLIHTRKEGRVRHCAIDTAQVAMVGGWLEAQRAVWESRTDRLETFLINKDKEQGK